MPDNTVPEAAVPGVAVPGVALPGAAVAELRAVLVGGPAALTAERRVQSVRSTGDTLKLPLGAGYEHFRHQGESTVVDGEQALVYRWVMHTAIAE
ncbi:DUF5988 family protein [Nonomuraea sp. NPDC050783]|uniref:DUF5988 family protein n=1 Tax=Nonomuraea sp. NPDC050783 TaxID=3154634 RepID=UPI003466AEF6